MSKKLKALAVDLYYEQFDGVSDLDYGYNPETGVYDIPSIEWDTIYGCYWKRYESEEARTTALKAHNEHMGAWVAKKVGELREARKPAKKPTFGDVFPQLALLRS